MPLPGRGGRDVIDEYLECLIAPLVGVVPYPERTRLREETAFHLERLQDDYRSEGLAAEDAARQAVDDYGSSRQIADDFLESWFRKSSDRPLSRRFGHGSVIAFTTFALAQTVCVAIFQARIYLPSNSALSFAVSPAWFNEIFPPSVTVPEFTPLYALMILAALVSPILAGAVVGRSVPIHAARAAYQALLPCILFTFVSGVLLLPAKELLIFAVLQTVYWLPAGALSAALVSLYIRQRRCRYGGGR
ncbi:hypothetical protein EON81_05765 [bacterium]|nr:MAG: hypothetical protein EON81_05765 [bacterium]